MPKDYKDAPAPRAPGRVNHPVLLGMIIGLLLGVVISLAVALWLNRLANPFIDKGKPIEPLPRIAPAQPPPPPAAARAAEQAAKGMPDKAGAPAAKAKSDRPRFEFYQMLPGEKEVPDREAKAAASAPVHEAPRPGSSPAVPKPHSGDVYWLQAGAFGEEKEADNLRAKIALTGLEASVQPVAIPDRGTLYRVRLGPYESLDDVNRIKAGLSQNGVGTSIIRTAEAARKP